MNNKKYSTCIDCGEMWQNNCPICKKSGFIGKTEYKKRKINIKKSKRKLTSQKKYNSKVKKSIEKNKQLKLFRDKIIYEINNDPFWKTIHPKNVVRLIKNGHIAACLCCDTIFNLTFDHIIPISKGGSNKLQNGQILCSFCNNLKADEIINIKKLKHIYKKQNYEK